MLNPPFATSLKVFKTKDGAPLQKENVIKFYKEYYESRGWQKGIAARQGDEPYLGLRVQVYDPGGALAQIHVAGELYLWIAPQDGMLTVYMSQWRISSMNQASVNRYNSIEETLKRTSERLNYSIQQVATYSNWEDYYKNEYLVKCEVLTLFSKSSPPRNDIDIKGRLNATLLVYKDSAVAHEQAKEFRVLNSRTIVQIDNALILLDTHDKTQAAIVEQIAHDIESQNKKLPDKSINSDKQ
jgi:hypothetical protein